MNKISIFLFAFLFAFTVQAKDLSKDITMISYEQSWLDYEGTLALKNNTNEEINNIVFIIKYLDMSGNDLDYKEFSDFVRIAPGMTKKLNIPAYEYRRSYHYYKTKDSSGHPTFKIKFVLKDYNVPKNEILNSESEDELNSSYSKYKSRYERDDYGEDNNSFFFYAIIAVVLGIGISVGLYVVVALMAQKRGRNVVLWIFLSILATPLLMIIILLIIGDDESRYDSQNWG